MASFKNNQIKLKDTAEHDDSDGLMLPDEKNSTFLRNALASGHINILLGSAFSIDVVPTLGYREFYFQAVEDQLLADLNNPNWITASDLLRAEYFRTVMLPLENSGPTEPQKEFLKTISTIVSNRGTTTIPQRINIFTTNYDPLIELSLEFLGLTYNDGFSGHNEPVFDASSFSNLQYSQSLFMEYASPITTVNVLKMHGSLTWRRTGEHVRFSRTAETLNSCLSGFESIMNLSALNTVKDIVEKDYDDCELQKLNQLASNLSSSDKNLLNQFRENYDSILCIVNPAKSKFGETVLERYYYDILRIYANELDRNNALLLVSCFSFADEHIRELTLRAAKSNPKLIVLISCYTTEVAEKLEGYFADSPNVFLLVPDDGRRLGLTELTEVLQWTTR